LQNLSNFELTSTATASPRTLEAGADLHTIQIECKGLDSQKNYVAEPLDYAFPAALPIQALGT
jgi:hypothetical protein